MSAPREIAGGGRRKRAVIIESQRLFVPYLTHTVTAMGADVLMTAKRPHARTLVTISPDLVVLDATHLATSPLNAIRTVRRAVPDATLVVFASEAAPWSSVARALGADVVLGSNAGRQALAIALEAAG